MNTEASIWDRERRWVTIGAVALIFLAAVEALAITTVMPIVAHDLEGDALFALAFAATLAAGVIGMVAAGAWSDARGPRAPLYSATGMFVLGLLVSGFAPTMELFILGRFLQGLGMGGQTVALYVVVARLYPQHLHGRVFAAFAAAWVVPSMVAPFAAGAVAEHISWRWTFWGVAVLTAGAFAMVARQVSSVRVEAGAASSGGVIRVRLALAVVVAAAVFAVGVSAEIAVQWGWPLAVAGLVLALVAVRPLLPAGVMRLRRGLPSVIVMRACISATFFASEIYIPYVLMEQFGISPTLAGLALMCSAIAWAVGSHLQGAYGERLGNARSVLLSVTGLVLGTLSAFLVALADGPVLVMIIGWGFAGFGMGILYPRLTVLTLGYSTTANQGFNSSALSIADSAASAVAIAIAGLVVATLGGGYDDFRVVFLGAAIIAALAVVPGVRMLRRDVA